MTSTPAPAEPSAGPHAGPPAGLVVRTLSRTADTAWFVVLALPVLGATLGGGGWLGMDMLDAVLSLMDHLSWQAAGHAVVSFAGVLGVLVVFRAWCALLRRQDSTVGRSRWQVRVVAVLMTVATVVVTQHTHPEANPLLRAAGEPPQMRTNWFPAVFLGFVSLSAALLMLVPGRAVVMVDRVQKRHHAGPRLRAAGRRAAAASARVAAAAFAGGIQATHSLQHAAASTPAQAVRLAAWLWPAPDRRLGAFLLMLPPMAAMLVPVVITLLYYGAFGVFYLFVATMVLPPTLLVALLALAWLLACVASLVALVMLWLALPGPRGAARLRTRALVGFGVVMAVIGSIVLRETPDNVPMTVHLQLGGVHVRPLMLAAFDGSVLLLLGRVPAWSARTETVTRVAGLVAIALAGAWLLA